jgi:hypothetical protein
MQQETQPDPSRDKIGPRSLRLRKQSLAGGREDQSGERQHTLSRLVCETRWFRNRCLRRREGGSCCVKLLAWHCHVGRVRP